MAIVKLPDQHQTITEATDVRDFLQRHGIVFEPWGVERLGGTTSDVPSAEILKAYAPEVKRLQTTGGYVTADIINVLPTTPNLDALLAKFTKEHRHADDEVRFTVHGRGVFSIHDEQARLIFQIEVGPGDLINVPAYTAHWFDLCQERTIQCIRLFKDPSGWTPLYTGRDIADGYPPVCLTPASFASVAPLS